MTECNNCGNPPKGVTMWDGMDGYSCPYCGNYNEFEDTAQEVRQG